ncbi:hypothetical protein BDN71DRAFT_574981 [Pleurotus eryngii]|uniref:Uncharacterized protein n=1 Tax=Pleurotus eryngii TaxID=5323 RepID=A0A9P5ZJM5_PLEER|nr:hypothetical protein BDN71DRAFT_574981 [Pleurotus eryngii]
MRGYGWTTVRGEAPVVTPVLLSTPPALTLLAGTTEGWRTAGCAGNGRCLMMSLGEIATRRRGWCSRRDSRLPERVRRPVHPACILSDSGSS